MKTINLILGNHNHQPVGNFDFVFESTYQKAYKPFLDMIEKYKESELDLLYGKPSALDRKKSSRTY